jgi:hypothetical protein
VGRSLIAQSKVAQGRDASRAGRPAVANAGSAVSEREQVQRGSQSPVASLVQEALASPGIALDAPTRAFMEPRLGQDFSRVRVHAEAPAGRSVEPLNALAYTVGEHIVFGPGRYRPHTDRGKHLLAHELVHVVQQRAGGVPWRPGPGGTKVGDPADRFERAAGVCANRLVATGEDLGFLQAPSILTRDVLPIAGPSARTAGRAVQEPAVIQRYQAGETGHGGIEERGLREAGLSRAEVSLVYYGNWLRDLSQLAGGAMNEVIRVLATGEFGRAPSDDELGTYIATEHLDRPEGGGTAEDPLASPQEHAQAMQRLSPAQRRWVDEQQTETFRAMIRRRSSSSGLPDWIERGKEHARRRLLEALALGRNADGFRAMGDGLHVVEDYFSHSNFTEVALAQLVGEGAIRPDNPLVLAMGRYIGVDPARVGTDPLHRPLIVTGTYAPAGNAAVSAWETIKTEIRTGALRSAFVRGFVLRYGWQGVGGGGRAVLGTIGGTLAAGPAAVGAGAAGLVTGAGRGAAEGWRSAGHWWSRPFAAAGGFLAGAATGAARGAASGARSGWRAGTAVGGAIGQGVFGAAGVALTGTTIAAVMTVATPLLAAAQAALLSRGGRRAVERTIERGTRESISRRDPRVPLPTHAQIAKDAPDHPLFSASAALAQEADREIGRAMISAWASTGTAQQRQATVDPLVDRFVAHPQAGAWWRPVLLAAARRAAPQPQQPAAGTQPRRPAPVP